MNNDAATHTIEQRRALADLLLAYLAGRPIGFEAMTALSPFGVSFDGLTPGRVSHLIVDHDLDAVRPGLPRALGDAVMSARI